jgi:hypothetical protein
VARARAVSCFEASVIEGYQRATCFENCICFSECLTARIRKSRREPTDGLKLANEHSRRCCGRLANLIEYQFGETFQPHRRHP